MKQEMKQLYKESGQVMNITGLLVGIAIGLGVFIIINIFMGTLGGRTYQLVESDLISIGGSSFTEELALNNETAYLTYDNGLTDTYVVKVGETIYGSGNFTYTSNSITPITSTSQNLSNVNITYDYGNPTISSYVQDGIAGSFQGSKTLGEYTPLIVLSIVIFLVLVLVTQFTGVTGGGAGGSVL